MKWSDEDLGTERTLVGRKKSLLDIASMYGTFELVGDNRYSGVCPFPDHADTSPSFFLYTGIPNEHFHCFGCGQHGDVIDLVRLVDGLPFEEAVQVACTKGSTIELFDTRHTPEKDLREQVEVALLMLGSHVRIRWFITPRTKWKEWHDQVCKLTDQVLTKANPVERVIQYITDGVVDQ